MNNLDRFMELLVAGVFLCDGLSKIFGYRWRARVLAAWQMCGPFGLSYRWLFAVGLFEIASALALAAPFGPLPPAVVVRLAGSALAVFTLSAGIYRVRHHEQAAPTIVLFLLAVFVIVGRSI
jgi:hypothetical protein